MGVVRVSDGAILEDCKHLFCGALFAHARNSYVLSGSGSKSSDPLDLVMQFTIEFFRLREDDDAHATLDRITLIGTDLEAVKDKAKSFFETLNMPQKPDGLRILDQDGDEVFFWTPGAHDA